MAIQSSHRTGALELHLVDHRATSEAVAGDLAISTAVELALRAAVATTAVELIEDGASADRPGSTTAISETWQHRMDRRTQATHTGLHLARAPFTRSLYAFPQGHCVATFCEPGAISAAPLDLVDKLATVDLPQVDVMASLAVAVDCTAAIAATCRRV